MKVRFLAILLTLCITITGVSVNVFASEINEAEVLEQKKEYEEIGLPETEMIEVKSPKIEWPEIGSKEPVVVGIPSEYATNLIATDDEQVNAQEKVWNIINTYADPNYFLEDPYLSEITEAEYNELKQAALDTTKNCKTQFEKIQAIVSLVANKIYYDYVYYNDRTQTLYINPYDVYVQERTVCSGYARLVRTLCISIGIPCMDLVGEDHEFNAIYDGDNNKWIFADATWCSGNRYTVNGEWIKGSCNLFMFNVSPEVLAGISNHEIYWIDGLLNNSVYYRIDYDYNPNTWKQLNGSAKITGKTVGTTKVVIPECIEGVPISGVGEGFYQDETIEEIDLSATKITRIGSFAFANASNLIKVVLPKSITQIDFAAFYNCINLIDADISKTNVIEISDYGFANCEKLNKLIAPATLINIGERAFNCTQSLEIVDLSKSAIDCIEDQMFMSNEMLTKVLLPDTVTNIGDYAFSGCSNLSSVKFPKKLKAIGEWAFYGTSIETLDLSDTEINSIGYAAFYYNDFLKTIKLPKSVNLIDDYAFGIFGEMDTLVVTPLSSKKINEISTETSWGKRSLQIIKYIYNIKFDGNNATSGKMSSLSCGSDISYILPQNKYTREYYSFSGWNTKADGSGISYNDKAAVINLTSKSNDTVTLYAKWKVNRYNIAFNGNGATSGSMSTLSNRKCTASYTLPGNTFEKKGYKFVGWNTKADGTGQSYENEGYVEKLTSQNGETITLYAQWKKVKYTITYELNGGTNHSDNPEKYYVTSSTIILKDPTRKGYTFKGWYSESEPKMKVLDIKKGSTGNKILHAKWSINKYNIAFNGNGATSGSMSTISNCQYTKSYTLTANEFKKKGYEFLGWNTKADGSGTFYKNKTSVKKLTASNGQTVTLYAQWKKVKYGLTYNLNKGTNHTDNPDGYYVTSSTIILKNPTRRGYTFKGWYGDSESKTRITEIKNGSTGSKTLYAKWSVNKYDVVFNGNGATSGKMSSIENCNYNKSYRLTTNAYKKKGYIFIAWNTKADGSGTAYDNKSTVKNLACKDGQTVTLYAQWKKK